MKQASLLLLIGAALGAGGMTFAHVHENGESVRVISARDINEKLDGKESKVTFVEGDPGTRPGR